MSRMPSYSCVLPLTGPSPRYRLGAQDYQAANNVRWHAGAQVRPQDLQGLQHAFYIK